MRCTDRVVGAARTIDFKTGLTHCLRHTRAGKVYGRATIFLQLVIHLLLGYRDLRESAYDRDDPMVKRLSDVSTLSRMTSRPPIYAMLEFPYQPTDPVRLSILRPARIPYLLAFMHA